MRSKRFHGLTFTRNHQNQLLKSRGVHVPKHLEELFKITNKQKRRELHDLQKKRDQLRRHDKRLLLCIHHPPCQSTLSKCHNR